MYFTVSIRCNITVCALGTRVGCCCGDLWLYHQWTAMGLNTVRFGAFSELSHVMLVFTSLVGLLAASLTTYIILPRATGPNNVDVFTLNMQSLLIGTGIMCI